MDIPVNRTGIGLTQEINYYLSFSYMYSYYIYPDQNPSEAIDLYPNLLAFVPQLESLLYDFYAKSQNLTITLQNDRYFANLYFQDAFTLAENLRSRTVALTVGRSWQSFDISVNISQNEYVEEKIGQSTMTFSYYF